MKNFAGVKANLLHSSIAVPHRQLGEESDFNMYRLGGCQYPPLRPQ
jgi:hypothetical protein